MKALRRRRGLLLAALGGVAFALTSPPTDLYPAVLVGLALLAASLEVDELGFRAAFGRGAMWGTSAGLVGLRFVPAVIQRFTPLGAPLSYLSLVLLAAAQSLIWALGAGVATILRRRAKVPFELSFGIGVLLSLSLPTIFAWSPAGLISPWPAFVQLADVIGERGVSVLIAFAAALLARGGITLARSLSQPIEKRPSPRAVVVPVLGAVAVIGVLAAYGVPRMAMIRRETEALPTVKVGLVDHAILPLLRWDPEQHPKILQSLHDLTIKSEAEGAELTIWPEGAYPYELPHDLTKAPPGRRGILGKGIKGPLLVGLITSAKPFQREDKSFERNSYNSATVVLSDGAMQLPYDKLQLLWFGEMVPGGAQLPWLRRMFQRGGGLIPGTEPRALDVPLTDGRPSLHVAVLNCYEDTLPDVGRRQDTTLSPNLLVNITNDAWFHHTAEPELHARLGAMRAIELRRDLVRSVNYGVTSWIDATGTVRARYAGDDPSMLLATPAIRASSPTLYARFGDAPLATLLIGLAAWLAWRARRPAPATS